MRAKLTLLRLKVSLSVRTTSWVLGQWRYALLAAVAGMLFFELLYWLLNLSVLTTIMTSSNVALGEKLRVLASPVASIRDLNGTLTLVLVSVIALVQGVSIALLTYSIRHQQKLDTRIVGGGTFVGLLALIGLGCPSCGTSLITPIVALFVSGSAVSLSEQITAIALPLALAIGLYGLYVLGIRTAGIRALAEQSSKSAK